MSLCRLKTQGRQVNKYEISPAVDINYKYINKGLNTKVGIEQAVEYLNLNSIGEDFPSLKLQHQLDGSMTIDEAKGIKRSKRYFKKKADQ